MADPTFDPVELATLERVQNADPEASPDMLERIRMWLKSLGGAQEQPASRGMADALNAQLPDALSGRPALMQAAQRRKMLIDAAMDEGGPRR